MNTYSTGYEVANPVLSIGRWELIVYLVLAFLIGYLIHYIFSSRRDYVRAPKISDAYYYANSQPIYPPRY